MEDLKVRKYNQYLGLSNFHLMVVIGMLVLTILVFLSFVGFTPGHPDSCSDGHREHGS